MERWIAETIESVLSQSGDFEIEYIVIDNSSQDGTLEIVKRYIEQIENGLYTIHCNAISMKYIVQKDKTMYEAINHGFSQAHGEIYAWINADDIYEQGAFNMISLAFRKFPEIQWLKGITSTINELGEKTRSGSCKIYHQKWIAAGIYGQEAYFIEQDSVFWSAALWEKTGGIPSTLRSAGDYWLWIQFAQHTALWSINIPISRFRKRAGQISKNIQRYKNEQWQVRTHRSISAWKARLFFTPQSRISGIIPPAEKFFINLYPLFFKKNNSFRYIEPVDGTLTMKVAPSYIISNQERTDLARIDTRKP